MPAVSVLIPAYNASAYLKESLESVAGQSFRDLEVVIVNDGSTDNTPEVASRFCSLDERFRLINRPNGGIAAARNTALDAATGRYICFVDADDRLYEDTVSLLMDGIESQGVRMVSGAISRRFDHHPVRRRRWRRLNFRQATEALLYQRGLDSGPYAKLYHRSVFDSYRYREGIIYEDLDLIYRLIDEVGEIAVTSDVVYYYRPNPQSIMNRFTRSRLDVLDVTRRIEEYMAEHHPELQRAARDRRLSANFNMYGLLALCGDSVSAPDTRRECWELIKDYRLESLIDPHVRLKNRLGILLSYLGSGIFGAVAKRYYR